VGITPHQGERESRLQGQVAQVSTINQKGGVCVMQIAEALLRIIHERGERGLPLERLYRHLFNPELYLRAYGKIYRNDGAMTPGANAETVDGMSLRKIQAIIEALRYERYRWTPVRRIYIDKKNSSKKRPLGLPTDVANRPFAQAAFGLAAGDVSVPPSGRAISGDLVLEAAWW
jgi:hypothetical protein